MRLQRKAPRPAAAGLCLLVLFSAATGAQAQQETLSVEQAVAEALRNNLSLVAERANISVAQARILTARLRPNPVVSIDADHLDLLGTGFSEINGAGPQEYSVRTDFTLERGGKRARRIEVAETARSAVEMQFREAVRQVVLEVQNAAVDVLLAKANLELARENLASASRIVEINAARLRAGDIPEVELMRSRVAAMDASNTVRRAELAVRLARMRLAPLLGRGPAAPLPDIQGELRRDPDVPPLPDLAAQALKARPDLEALRRELQRAGAELRLQQSQAKVDFVVGSEYRRQQAVIAKGNMLGFFVSAELPVFNRNQGEIERARQELRQTEARLRALETSIWAEVQRAYEDWRTSRDLLNALEKQMLEEARQVRDVIEYSYSRGEATLLELLDAQRAFNETRQVLNEARAEHARSLYLLEAVSGKEVLP